MRIPGHVKTVHMACFFPDVVAADSYDNSGGQT